jgi:hypothetical protein
MANEFIARKGLIALEASQITGSLTVNGGITGSLQGTSSWATNALTSSYLNNLNQSLAITGSVILSGSGLPELKIIGDTQFTGSVSSLNGYTGSLFGTASWATNAISSSLAVRNLITASVSLNTITFTKGDGTTFPIVVNTGSGGGGGGGVTINNNVDNYLVTATGTANTLNGEANLTFDDGTLTLDVASATGGTVSADTFAAANFITVERSGYGYLSTPRNMISLPQSTPAYGFPMPGCKIADAWDVGGGVTTLRSGSIVYFKYDVGLGVSEWEPAHAHTTASAIWPLGVVTDTISQSEIILEGVVRMTGSFSGRAGQPLYLAATLSGSALTTAPTGSGRVVRLVGYLLDENRNLVYFNPSMDWSVLV